MARNCGLLGTGLRVQNNNHQAHRRYERTRPQRQYQNYQTITQRKDPTVQQDAESLGLIDFIKSLIKSLPRALNHRCLNQEYALHRGAAYGSRHMQEHVGGTAKAFIRASGYRRNHRSGHSSHCRSSGRTSDRPEPEQPYLSDRSHQLR